MRNLRHEKDVVSKSNVGTPLKDKQHLHSLELFWKYREDVNAVEEDIIKSMEVLQPYSNLKQLTMCFYSGVRFASWFSSLINIVNLTMWDCKRCQHLPPLDHFPSLKFLRLHGLEKLEYISENESSISMSDEMMRISFFPSLEDLYIADCPVLKGWWRAHTHNTASSSSSSSSTENMPLPSFPRLSILTILECPNLTSLPEGTRGLPCLNRLQIYRFPMLSERCKKETGEDWPKIAHIPYIANKRNKKNNISS
ncbi:disease resistance protein RGA2-like [Pyrus ussuriensis x Pyrus communis]|uniref:Disease resistance protein RGA2-like n=1 Tax=Pyrus ussuriensis x Pyrus communis TaxID=2448454 RepID=A0A5N5EVF1_9ROSA|nr:disease resistance protein RGA2-like [Pyrus ussuriensis x Pyrus communis]